MRRPHRVALSFSAQERLKAQSLDVPPQGWGFARAYGRRATSVPTFSIRSVLYGSARDLTAQSTQGLEGNAVARQLEPTWSGP
jgi:hypothetical protein